MQREKKLKQMDQSGVSDEATDRHDVTAGAPKPVARRGRTRRVMLFALILVLAVPVGLAALMLRPNGIELPAFARDQVALGLSASLPPGAKIRIGTTRLRLSTTGRPSVAMQDVSLIDRDGRQIARVPQVVTALHRQGVVFGRIQPSQVSLNGLTIAVARATDGSFLISLGDDAPLPAFAGLGDIVAWMNDTMSQKRLAALEVFSLSDLTLRIRDPRAGRAFGLVNGAFDLTRSNSGLEASLSVALQDPNGAGARLDPRQNSRWGASQIRAALRTDGVSRAAELDLMIHDISPRLIAAQSPDLAGLGVVDAPLSVALRGGLDDQGVVSALSGTVALGAGRVTVSGRETALERVKAYVQLDPRSETLVLESLELRSASASFDMVGTVSVVLAERSDTYANRTGVITQAPFADLAAVAQLQITDLALDLPVDSLLALPGPVHLDQVLADLRYNLNTGQLDLGSVIAKTDGLQARLSGRVTPTDAGALIALDGALQQFQFADGLTLWPLAIARKTRQWLHDNLAEATIDRLDFAVRRNPGRRLNVALSGGYRDARLTFLPDMPDMTEASGFFSLNGTRFALSIDQGTIVAEGAALAADGSVFWVENTQIKQRQGRVALQIDGPIGGAFALLTRAPVNMPLDTLPITGRAEFAADIAFPMVKGGSAEDIKWNAQGSLQQVVGDMLLQGRELRAARLQVAASPQELAVTGGVQVQGVPAKIQLTSPVGPEASQGVALSGTLDLSADALAKFGVSNSALEVSGRAPARFELDIRPQAPPNLRLRSSLEGVALSVPSLGWIKPPDLSADLALDMTLSNPVQITSLSLDGAGLQASGSVRLNADASLEVAIFDQVTLDDWLDVSAIFTGRGPDRPPALALRRGRLDLRGFSNRSVPTDQAATAWGPITVALDRLQLADAIQVTELHGEIAGGPVLEGRFSGRINDETPITAALAVNQGRTGLRVKASDAGAALAAMGVLRTGRGGALELVMRSRSGGAVSNTWDGLLTIENLVVENAPALAGLLSAISVVGIVEQMGNGGLSFTETSTELTISPKGFALRDGRANGPSMGITFEGLISPERGVMDLQGVVSPLNILNGIGGALFARRGEGLFGFSYRLSGPMQRPNTEVNPLSILTPGVFRDIFRREPPVLD